MPTPTSSPPAARDGAELPALFVGIVLVEVVVIVGLYWIGRYFGS